MTADEELGVLGHAVAGGIGGAMGLLCTYPLDVIKTRMQVQTKQLRGTTDYKNTFDGIQKIFRQEGVAGLYSGLNSGLLATLVQQFVYYYCYETLKPMYQGEPKRELSNFWQLMLGIHAASLNSVATLPITVVNTRMQTADIAHRKGMLDTTREILSKEGPAGLWRGVVPSIILSINPAITFLVFEKLKAFFEARARRDNPKARLTTFQFFLIGAFAKTCATIATYPYIMAKTRMQWKANDESAAITYNGALDVLQKVYGAAGIAGWYQGMQAQILKAVLTQAIQFTMKEEIAIITLRLYLLSLTLRGLRASKRAA